MLLSSINFLLSLEVITLILSYDKILKLWHHCVNHLYFSKTPKTVRDLLHLSKQRSL